MSNTRIHHALPAPVVHAGFSVSQSKSTVLAGVRDAYWSEEEDDEECPLCLEEMDISDRNFKPCVCGYQICRFCWHHIKENLNKRCPACRRVYTEEGVEFKPINPEDHKRLTQQKKQREREKKELDALGRRQYANVRVVQRNVVYVVGLNARFAKEELLPTLRSNEYFGQYGKITKMVLVNKKTSSGGGPELGLYITFYRREDAARAITAVDGSPSPGAGGSMKASYGTTKYCMAFLRGAACGDHSCMNLHEWGDEKDCFTKEDLTTLKHTMKATESRARTASASVAKKADDSEPALPRSAAWGSKPIGLPPINHSTANPASAARATRRGGARTGRTVTPVSPVEAKRPAERKPSAKLANATSSRPTTPAPSSSGLPPRPSTPASESKPSRLKKESAQASAEPPAPSVDETELNPYDVPDTTPAEPLPATPSPDVSTPSTPAMPPGIPAVPPGLSAPPGIPLPLRPPRVDTPQTPLLATQSSYQMSTAALALVEDVRARREALHPPGIGQSPFPDFDRTLQILGQSDSFGGFSFNLDPKLAGTDTLNDLDTESQSPFRGTYLDAFPGVNAGRIMTPPPGLAYPHNPNRSIYDPMTGMKATALDTHSTGGSSGYMGSFDPFADANETSQAVVDDGTRKVSRFGFARGRQGSSTAHVLGSPSMRASAPSPAPSMPNHALYSSGDPNQTSLQSQWAMHGYTHPISNTPSPLIQHAQLSNSYMSQQQHLSRGQYQQQYEPGVNAVSETQLRDFIQSSRDRANVMHPGNAHHAGPKPMTPAPPGFSDPAIMSASRFTPEPSSVMSTEQQQYLMGYGPPPGLHPQGHFSGQNMHIHHADDLDASDTVPHEPALSPADFPSLSATIATPSPTLAEPPTNAFRDSADSTPDSKAQEKAERRAAKQAAAAERAAERQRIAQEKAAIKAAEKANRAKLAQERAVEQERLEEIKAEQQRVETIAKEKERVAREERERRAREAKEKEERERLVHLEKEKTVQAASKKAITNQTPKPKAPPSATTPPPVPTAAPGQVPLLSKKPKKNKPVTRPIRVPKEDDASSTRDADDSPFLPTPADNFRVSYSTPSSSNRTSRAQSMERSTTTSLSDMLGALHVLNPYLNLPNHPIFDTQKINSSGKMPLEYAPLVHALSALSVGGGSFANNVPSGSIDNAVSSFQQLLETLTQTISDLLRLLPRTTWDDSSSFDGVLRDMLKGDDFLDDSGDAETDEEGLDASNAGGSAVTGKEDEVAALTLALERRARWMEVQLSKLEELHRDINTAAVKAILTFNDNGWDRHGFMPHIGKTLRRFETLGLTEDENAELRPMTADELEEKLAVAKEATVFAETEVREMMERMNTYRPSDEDF